MSDRLQQVIELFLALSQTPATQAKAEKDEPGTTPSTPPFAIVIATNGFIFIGDAVVESDHVLVEPKAGYRTGALRIWGTTKGLGELAANGPTPNTVIDEIGSTVLINREHFIGLIPCHTSKFAK